jgi:hypothetical protein
MLDDDRRLRLISRAIDGGVKLGGMLIVAEAIVWVASYLRDVLVAFAGHETSANVFISLLAKIEVDRWAAYLLGGGGVAYGLSENRLRRRITKRLTARPAELETRLHAGRTSSGLTPEGRTRREDR